MNYFSIVAFNRLVFTGIVVATLFTSCKKESSSIPPSQKSSYAWDKFSMGADLSYATQMAAMSYTYTDSDRVKDVFTIFRDYGCNTVRVRLFVNPPTCVNGSGGTDVYARLTNVEALIARAKALHLAVNLDLHYSDCWADPGNQYTPAAWQSCNGDVAAMSDSVYAYTTRILNELKSKSLVPEMIQIGNEVSNGMLWPTGKVVNGDFTSLGQLLNSGIRAVRDFSLTSTIKPKIILHCSSLDIADWWTNGIIQAGVTDFDMVGFSYYFNYLNSNSQLTNMNSVAATIRHITEAYGKPVIIVEVAYYWTNSDAKDYFISSNPILGYPFTPNGQCKFMKDFTQAVIDGGGVGVQYWAPDYRNTPWGGEMEARALFDFNGDALPALNFMNSSYNF